MPIAVIVVENMKTGQSEVWFVNLLMESRGYIMKKMKLQDGRKLMQRGVSAC